MMIKKDEGADNFSNSIDGNPFGQSITGKFWQISKFNDRDVLALQQKFSIPESLATVMLARGVTVESAEDYLDPKLKNLLPDPFLLTDMDKAVDRIIQAIQEKQKITIFGDYDVDGATSSSLLKRFFRTFDMEVDIYIPHRINEGYGPNSQAMEKIKAQGSKLVITVDCGIVSYEPLAHAKAIGLDVIVLDHHLGAEKLPEAVAIVNPNRIDDSFPIKNIAAVGVAFFTAIAIRSKLRQIKYFKNNQIKEPDLLKLLDLVALGTVCDVMELQGLNRAFVAQGLKLIKARNNIGLATLGNLIGIDSDPKCHHLGFVIGPRINAGGRVGRGSLGAALLSTQDSIEALEISKKLDALNTERRDIEANVLSQAMAQIEEKRLYEKPVIVAYGEDWHLGILGILASKLKDKYSKPALVISIIDGEGKGSARSIEGINLGAAIAAAKQQGIILDGGGHAMAGGFTVQADKIDDFYQYLISISQNKTQVYKEAKAINGDFITTVESIDYDFAMQLEMAAPFGNGNPQPKIILQDVLVLKASIIGGSHVMLIVRDKHPISKFPKTLKAVFYRAGDKELTDELLALQGKNINLIGTLQFNSWHAKKIDFVIEDIAFDR